MSDEIEKMEEYIRNLSVVETKISDIVLPKDTDGKVRTSKIKVLSSKLVILSTNCFNIETS